eukprot:m.174846 g.174846  ORF g.174846 m.174846 type:complete len:284 (+) comp13880_c0_seq1:133-984(+)
MMPCLLHTSSRSEAPSDKVLRVPDDDTRQSQERKPNDHTTLKASNVSRCTDVSMLTTAPLTCHSGTPPQRWAMTEAQLVGIRTAAIAQAHDLGQDYAQWTIRDINTHVVLPTCRAFQTSYALSVNPVGCDTEVFVSHTWDDTFEEMFTCITNAFGAGNVPNVWICTFALRQDVNVADQIGHDIATVPFVQALRAANTMLVVRSKNKDLYTRMWCVCELVFAIKVCKVDSVRVCGPNTFAESTVSCTEAQCRPADKERIMKVLLEHSSVKEMDAVIGDLRKRIC